MGDVMRFDFSWKCPVCGMHQRKEPHRRLADHMAAAHNLEPCEDQPGRWVTRQQKPSDAMVGLTVKEKEILDHTVAIWHGVTRDLPDTPADELGDIERAIHAIQATIAMRVARRVDPDYWRK